MVSLGITLKKSGKKFIVMFVDCIGNRFIKRVVHIVVSYELKKYAMTWLH